MRTKLLKSFSLLLASAFIVCSIPSLAGCSGTDGVDGTNGVDGVNGIDGTNGADGADGINGTDGVDGTNGTDGTNGLSTYEIYCKYHPAYKGTEEEWINAYCNGELEKSYSTTYNIIYTLATVPPVLAALDCIDSGYETYAYIERGKTYNGIEQVDNFYNIGFDTTNNTSTGFSQESFELVVEKIEELNVYGNEHFNIYVQDGTGLFAFALAGNAGLSKDQLSVKLLEDGSEGTYGTFNTTYLSGKIATADNDEIYDYYVSRVAEVTVIADNLFNSTDNTVSSVSYDLTKAMAIAGIEGYDVEYVVQDQARIKNLLDATVTGDYHTKLYSAFGISGYTDEVDVNTNLRYLSISDGVSSLSEDNRTAYLTLMYGSYYSDTYAALTRTTLSDGTTTVPSKKLVFIGTRIRAYQAIATTTLGVSAATSVSDIASSYATLDSQYKTDLLFATEDDYNVFLNIFTATTTTSNTEYTNLSNDVKDQIKVKMFNYYLNYICTLKYTYLIYGSEYDIIMKGHPSEVYGEGDTWSDTNYYVDSYNFGWLLDDLIVSFHTSDSVGKYIGIMPYGTAAENLAYIGVDIAIGGLPSSTYTGYEESVPVLFVMNATANTDISADTNLNSRYTAGTLDYTDSEGNTVCTTYYNKGVIYKTLYDYYTSESNTDMATKYSTLYTDWLKTMLSLDSADGYYVDDQGFIVASGE